jgi:hypothetical protein
MDSCPQEKVFTKFMHIFLRECVVFGEFGGWGEVGCGVLLVELWGGWGAVVGRVRDGIVAVYMGLLRTT